MVRNRTPRIKASQRTLAMLEAVIEDEGGGSISAVAKRIGVPVATAHRQVATLVDAGFLSVDGAGAHHAGPRLLAMMSRLDEKQAMVNIAAAPLHALASRLGAVVQLGTFENEMVTYRIKTGRGAMRIFSRVGMQLEAYCTGIGKVLLAHLPDHEREAYLEAGSFIALTERTIIDPAALRDELRKVRVNGYALDDEEAAPGLRCLAVPLHAPSGRVVAAVCEWSSVRWQVAHAAFHGFDARSPA